ncbi:MAG: hypothetical protein M1825_002529 [Sarcosagium campestre]|nr:MAG: hypothetical protein M1825_002529 [Sarcosagium campestre]
MEGSASRPGGEDPAEPPAKKTRLSPSNTSHIVSDAVIVDEVDDLDDLYETDPVSQPAITSPQPPRQIELPIEDQSTVGHLVPQDKSPSSGGGLPGLGLLDGAQITLIDAPTVGSADQVEFDLSSTSAAALSGDRQINIKQEFVDDDNESKSAKLPGSTDGNGQEDDPSSVQRGLAHSPNDAEGGNSEWRFDASDVASESSTDSDSSSDDSVDAEDDYQLLDPEEQARILMMGDGGSDDDAGPTQGGKSSSAVQPRTKNEIPEDHIPKPDIQVTPEMAIEALGTAETTVDNILLVTAKIAGDYQVLESGSLLCLGDRSVIGVVAETLGRVQQPMYSIRFNSRQEIIDSGITVGTPIFYVKDHSTYVFTQPLRAMKGSDASNFYDEEVGRDEVEFSDDEAEAEYKRKLKMERQAKKGARGGHDSRHQRSDPRRDSNLTLSYDDVPTADNAEDGELYTPLARPADFHELMGQSGAAMEGGRPRGNSTRGERGGRERGRGQGSRRGGGGPTTDNRGRPRRGGGGGERGRGADRPDRRVEGSRNLSRVLHDQPPAESTSPPFMGNAGPYGQDRYGYGQGDYRHPSERQLGQYQHMTPPQYQGPHQTGVASHNYNWPPFNPQTAVSAGSAYVPDEPQLQPQPQPQHSPISPAGTLPPGAYVNPAFFRNQQQSPIQGYWQPPTDPATPFPTAGQSGPTTSRSPDADAAFRAAQEKIDILRGLSRGASGSP